MSDDRKNLTSPGGDVRRLLPFRKAVIIYDLTFHFAHAFLDRTDRTVDQMIQAARSGKQNIAEYALGGLSNNIFASRYVLYIPNKEQLIAQVEAVLGKRAEG